MRVVHFDCFSGISGDMVLAAALDAGAPAQALQDVIASLNLPIRCEIERVKRCGFAATYVSIQADDQESYRFLPDVEAIIDRAAMTEAQKAKAREVFRKVAVAEAAVHGMPLERVHFHEVGALDSLADILGAAVLLDHLGADGFTSSPVPTGTGTVRCAHGIMPVPTPGTTELLRGVPLAPSTIKAELTTPTGAAILTTYASEFTATPAMTIERIGTGAGTKDFLEQPNILRLWCGEAASRTTSQRDRIVELQTNLDHVSPEIIGYATERLFAAGALDVYQIPMTMKKQRTGILLCVLCPLGQEAALETILFQETGTLGIRRTIQERQILPRETETLETPWGPVRMKVARGPAGDSWARPEWDDCSRLAREHQLPLRQITEWIQARWHAGPKG